MKNHFTKYQFGFTLIEILIVLAVLVITLAGGVATLSVALPRLSGVVAVPARLESAKRAVRQVWEKKVSPTPKPISTPAPTLPEKPADQCSGLNEKECLANPDCLPVYGPSCPACMDIKFERCRDRLSCQTSADCPPVLGVCVPGKCPTYRCINGRCVLFGDSMVLRSCLEKSTLQECVERYGQ